MLGTRAGTAWGLRLLDWALLGGLLAALSARRALPALRPASLGAVGQALPRSGRSSPCSRRSPSCSGSSSSRPRSRATRA